jgi:DNA-directed RNA polymerase specialized sigma24 family protein
VRLHVDGRASAFPADVFHDGLNHAYLELATQVASGAVAWGRSKSGLASAVAVRGFANRRLHSRIIDELRRRDRVVAAAEQPREPVYTTSAEAQAMDRAGAFDALRTLAALDSADRRLVLLSADGVESSAIARELSIGPAAARQRLSRARRRLRMIAETNELKAAA